VGYTLTLHSDYDEDGGRDGDEQER
jgi:hypothetical protein